MRLLPFVSLAADSLALFHKYVPDSCVVPELSSGRRGFLSSKSDSSAFQGLFLPDLHKEEFVNAAEDLSSSTGFLKRQVDKYAFVPQDADLYLCPKRVSPKLVAVASRLGKKFGTRGPFDKSDNLLFDLSSLTASGLRMSVVMDLLVELLASADDLHITVEDRIGLGAGHERGFGYSFLTACGDFAFHREASSGGCAHLFGHSSTPNSRTASADSSGQPPPLWR